MVDFTDTNEVTYSGHVLLKNVEIKRMSQYDTTRAAIRFERAG